LENSASKFAAEAIQLDCQGARGMAISNYQRAIKYLNKLIHLYPDNKLNRVYRERITAYQNRIKAIQPDNVPYAKRFDVSISNLLRERLNTIMKSNPNISYELAVAMMRIHLLIIYDEQMDPHLRNSFYKNKIRK